MDDERWLYFILGSSQQQQTSQVYKIDGEDLMSNYEVTPNIEFANLAEMILASIAESE